MALNKQQYEQRIKSAIVRDLARSWAENGHKLTNDMIDSLEVEIVFSGVSIGIKVKGNAYGIYMNKGVGKSKIPYSGRTGKGGTSLYIQGLMDYVQKRKGFAVGSKENKSFAFAIAASHKKHGMPIRTGGRGTRWIDKEKDNILDKVSILTLEFIDNEISISFKTAIDGN